MSLVQLGEICSLRNGRAFKPEEWSEHGTPIIRIQNLNDESKPFNYCAFDVPKHFWVESGDLLFSWSGTPGTSFGAFFWNRGRGFLNQHIFRVDVRETAVDRGFLRYALNSKLDEIISQSHGGVGLKHITKGKLEGLKLRLPPLPEQRRIAAILDKAEALRAKRREAIAKCDQLLQSVFFDIFGNGTDCQFPRVPLEEACWFQEGPGVRKWQFRDRGIKLLNVGNIEKDGSINLSKTDRHVSVDEAQGRYKHFLVDEGDLVIASSGVSFDTDGLLRTRGAFIERTHLPLCMNTSTIRFKAVAGKSNLYFLKAWIDNHDFRTQITRLVTGSAQQNFGPSHLKRLLISLPPLDVQKSFGRRAEAVADMKLALQRSQMGFDLAFASLQHALFSGDEVAKKC